MPYIFKEELLDSLTKIEDEDKPGPEEAMKNTKEPREVIKIITRYGKILIAQNKKINIVRK